MYSDKFQMNAIIVLKGEKEREKRGENQVRWRERGTEIERRRKGGREGKM